MVASWLAAAALLSLSTDLSILPLHNRTEREWSPLSGHGDAAMRIATSSAVLKWQLPGLSFTKSARLSVSSGLVSALEAKAIIEAIPSEMSKDPDSVDQMPSYEHILFAPGLEDDTQSVTVGVDGSATTAAGVSDTSPDALLRSLTLPLIRSRILPFVRETYNCSSCRMCHSLVRRYKSDERMEHPAHFDTQVYSQRKTL